MNNRLVIAMALSVATMVGIQYFTSPTKQVGPNDASGDIKSGQFYAAKVQQTWNEEPNREIDFIDAASPEESIETVETDYYVAAFSNIGGVLKSLAFKEHKGLLGHPLKTVLQKEHFTKEEGCFLLALEAKTPLTYKFVGKEKVHNGEKLTYKASVDNWLIKKSFILSNKSYQIDMEIDFEPQNKKAAEIVPRIFFSAPSVDELEDDDVSGFVLSGDGKKISDISSDQELAGVWGMPELFGSKDKYFVHALVKDEGRFARGGYYKRVNNHLYSILVGDKISEKKTWNVSFYMGPKSVDDLTIADERLSGVLSFGFFSWLSKFLLKLLIFLYQYLGNYGLAIIALTILVKLPFVPLSIIGRRKFDHYQKYQHVTNKIRQKYKADPAKMNQELMAFYKDHNISPAAPVFGCLPMFIQLPILFSLYRVLGSYIDLYQAPFFGWVVDLSARDPYYVLPVLMGIFSLWQQKMSPSGDEKMRVAMMFMPILMTAVFINFPAGVVLYWLTNNILMIAEELFRKKVLK